MRCHAKSENAILQTNVTVFCVQEFIDSSISVILFLLTAPIASLVSLFSLETKPSLLEGNCEIHKLQCKICLMIFQTWFNVHVLFPSSYIVVKKHRGEVSAVFTEENGKICKFILSGTAMTTSNPSLG